MEKHMFRKEYTVFVLRLYMHAITIVYKVIRNLCSQKVNTTLTLTKVYK